MKNVRILTGVAVVSVILNLFLAGYLAGQAAPRFWQEPRPREQFMPGPMGRGDINIFAGMRALDPGMRAKARQTFERHMPELRASVEDMMAKRRALVEILAAPASDMDQLTAAFADLRRANATVQDVSHRAFLDVAQSLPAEQRAALFKATATPRRAPGDRRRPD